MVDLLKSKLTGSTRLPDGTWQEYNTSEVYLNNGNGWTQSNSWSIPLAFFYSKDSWDDYLNQSIQVIDINGDGLSDIVRSLRSGGASVCINGNCQIGINGGSKIYLNNGNGWVNDTSWQMPLPFYELDMNSSGFVRSIFIADANGDNLPDLFKSMLGSSVQLPDGTWQESNNSDVYLSNGKSWVKDNSRYLPLAMSSYFDTEGKLSHGSITMDINGDGLQDIVRLIGSQVGLCLSGGNCQYISDANSRQVYLNNSRKSDLLTRITYGTGGKTDITYKATPLYSTGSNLSNPK